MDKDILASDHLGRLLAKLSVPAMVGMMVMVLYNVVDMIFVGRWVGAQGIAGISIAFPIQLFVMAIGQMLGFGGASVISRALGMGERGRADRTLGNVILCALVFSAALVTVGGFFLDPLLRLFGATDTLLPYARDYMGIILFGSIFFAFGLSTNNLIRAEGRAMTAMITMLIAAVLNIFFDAVFIVGLGWGLKGAAAATVLAQAVSAIYLAYYYLSGRSRIHFRLSSFKPDFPLLGEIFAVGSAAFARHAASAAFVVVLNNSLAFYGGDLSVAVFGVLNRLLLFCMMPIMGIAQGVQPIAGFNYGAGRLDKTRRIVGIGMVSATAVSLVGFVLLMAFPRPFIGIFSRDTALIEQATFALRLMFLGVPFIGYGVIGATLFQAIGKALPGLMLTLTRQCFFLIPVVLVLPRFIGLKGIWLSFPISDVMAAAVTFILLRRQYRAFEREPLPTPDPEPDPAAEVA